MPQPLYSPDFAPCNFWLSPKLKSPLKGKRFQTIIEIQKNTMGQLMAIGELHEVPRCLLSRGLRRHCPMYNASSFHSGWPDTFWTGLTLSHPLLSTHPVMDSYVFSRPWWLCTMLRQTWEYRFLFEIMISFPLDQAHTFEQNHTEKWKPDPFATHCGSRKVVKKLVHGGSGRCHYIITTKNKTRSRQNGIDILNSR